MSNIRKELIDLLMEEMSAMETADGKGIQSTTPEKMPKMAKGVDGEEEKIKLSGDQGDMGGKLPVKPPVGKVPAGDHEMGDNGGKGVAKATPEAVTLGSGTGECMAQDGKSVADKTVTQTTDLPKNPNVAESKTTYTLPHDVVVESDGKQMKLAAGTKFYVVAEEKDCDDSMDACTVKDCKDEKCPTHGKKHEEVCESKAAAKPAKVVSEALPFGDDKDGEDAGDEGEDGADTLDFGGDDTDNGTDDGDDIAMSDIPGDMDMKNDHTVDGLEVDEDSDMGDVSDADIIDTVVAALHSFKDAQASTKTATDELTSALDAFMKAEKHEPEHMDEVPTDTEEVAETDDTTDVPGME